MKRKLLIALSAIGFAVIGAIALIFQQFTATKADAASADGSIVPNEFKYTNRLINSKSPYLLLHAHNPVDWYPWGEEAFAKARKENKPVFLSVGYSTCHWCHVMAHESFENPQIAKILNDNFVCIKVDREERPDIDGVYMTFVQATTGSGGWPMSVWLTPDLKPFFGGSYYPPEEFTPLLEKIAAEWNTDHDKILASADDLVGQLRQITETAVPAGSGSGKITLDQGYEEIKSSYEPDFGGF
ncbi:MAG: thioredoxin domain-containing protein, partial [Verrucomicrobiota bacterium]